jgi:predicted ATP-dependent serine protease
LIGRGQERAVLGALVADAQEGRSGVLVLRGEPGIGKSALLDDVAGVAQGFLVMRASGVESEMELAYAGLQQLCRSSACALGSIASCDDVSATDACQRRTG